MNRILTCFIVTHASIVFSVSSSMSHNTPSQVNGMLLYRSYDPVASVVILVPRIFGAKLLDQ